MKVAYCSTFARNVLSSVFCLSIQTGEPGSSGFGGLSSSPKSPLSPDQSRQEKGDSFKCML